MSAGGVATIDRRSPVTLHHQCKELLRQRIQAGEFQPGDTIPPERELEARYGLSRTTVRQAISELVSEGVLYRQQGRGTFVSRHNIPYDLRRLTSFTEDMRLRGHQPATRLLQAGLVTAPEPAVQALGLLSAQAFLVERLRLADGESMGIHTAYLPPQLAVDPRELAAGRSLYGLLAERHHVTVAKAEETLEAVAAPGQVAALLGVRRGMPLMRVERVTYADSGDPVEYVVMLYRADRYKYYALLTR